MYILFIVLGTLIDLTGEILGDGAGWANVLLYSCQFGSAVIADTSTISGSGNTKKNYLHRWVKPLICTGCITQNDTWNKLEFILDSRQHCSICFMQRSSLINHCCTLPGALLFWVVYQIMIEKLCVSSVTFVFFLSFWHNLFKQYRLALKLPVCKNSFVFNTGENWVVYPANEVINFHCINTIFPQLVASFRRLLCWLFIPAYCKLCTSTLLSTGAAPRSDAKSHWSKEPTLHRALCVNRTPIC